MVGVKGTGVLSPSAGSEAVVDGVGELFDWAYRLQGWVARRIRRGERRLSEKKECGSALPVLGIAKREKGQEEGGGN